jgi:hypothetical protein
VKNIDILEPLLSSNPQGKRKGDLDQQCFLNTSDSNRKSSLKKLSQIWHRHKISFTKKQQIIQILKDLVGEKKH